MLKGAHTTCHCEDEMSSRYRMMAGPGPLDVGFMV